MHFITRFLRPSDVQDFVNEAKHFIDNLVLYTIFEEFRSMECLKLLYLKIFDMNSIQTMQKIQTTLSWYFPHNRVWQQVVNLHWTLVRWVSYFALTKPFSWLAANYSLHKYDTTDLGKKDKLEIISL